MNDDAKHPNTRSKRYNLNNRLPKTISHISQNRVTTFPLRNQQQNSQPAYKERDFFLSETLYEFMKRKIKGEKYFHPGLTLLCFYYLLFFHLDCALFKKVRGELKAVN